MSCEVKCDNCGKIHTIPESGYRLWKHHFCSKQCYMDYRKAQKIGFTCNRTPQYKKIIELAKLRKKKQNESKQREEDVRKV